MIKGITKGYLTHMIKDKITKGNVLKTILLDEKKSITLRYIKIKSILAAVDS